jgi:hypothetical protein
MYEIQVLVEKDGRLQWQNAKQYESGGSFARNIHAPKASAGGAVAARVSGHELFLA